ncbi:MULTISPECIES: DUF1801 domain-containing protein [Chitinophagaceae]
MSYKAKTTETENSVTSFIESIDDQQKQKDSVVLIDLMQKISGYEPKMWGTNIIGFGSYHYKYESGHEGDIPLLGFSPRKTGMSIYLSCDISANVGLLSKLGKHKMAKACLSIKRLSDININVLETMLRNSLQRTTKNKV